jgi:hypothetical protein
MGHDEKRLIMKITKQVSRFRGLAYPRRATFGFLPWVVQVLELFFHTRQNEVTPNQTNVTVKIIATRRRAVVV